MSRFITVTLAKGSEEGLENDTPIVVNTHYIIKVIDSGEDDYGKATLAMATGEFLFVMEGREEVSRGTSQGAREGCVADLRSRPLGRELG